MEPQTLRDDMRAKPGVPVRVLVVEDNRDIRESLQLLLQLYGHEVEVAEDGLEGVNRALRSHPDAVLIDIGLPILDGYEVARRLRAAFDGDIHLAACTAYGQPEDREHSEEAGFETHLVKPIDPVELMAWLETLEH